MKRRFFHKKNIAKNILQLFVICLLFTVLASAQLPSEEYYDDNIKKELPSDNLQSNTLRSEWDEEPTGPGGSGEGGNEWVGAPVGDSVYHLLFASSVYVLILILRRKNANNVNK